MSCETRGTIRRIIEEEGEFLVSLPSHDGYFKVTPSPHAQDFKKKIFLAQEQGKEIAFTYDRELNILEIR